MDSFGICDTCNLKFEFVPPDGPSDADIYVAGMCPGAQEVIQGKPFVGPAGRLLRDALFDAGIDVSTRVRFFNVVGCRAKGPRGENRDPTPQEVERCKPYIFADIRKVRPKVILCMGKVAASAFIDVGAFSKVTEMLNRSFEWEGIPLFVTYHPSYIVRRGSRSSLYDNYVSWFRRTLLNDSVYSLKSYRVLTADQFLSWRPLEYEVGFDIETNGYDVFSPELFVCGIGFSSINGDAVYVQITSTDEFYSVSEHLKDILLSHKIYVFNFSYEGSVLAHLLGLNPYDWDVVDTRQTALTLGIKGSLKEIAGEWGFPSWSTRCEEVVTLLDDFVSYLYSHKKLYRIFVNSLDEFLSVVDFEKDSFKLLVSNLMKVYSIEGCIPQFDAVRRAIISDIDRRVKRKYFDLVPLHIVSEYCCYDSFAAIKLHHILFSRFTEEQKSAFGFLMEQSLLGVALQCGGIVWNVDKARYLDDLYKKEILESLRSVIVNPRMQYALGLSNYDVVQVRSTSDLELLKSYFNPASNHSSTREKFIKALDTPFCRRSYGLYRIFLELNSVKNDAYEPIRKAFISLMDESYSENIVELKRKRREFICSDQCDVFIRSILDLWEEVSRLELEALCFERFYLPKLDESILIPLYESFTRIGGIDIDDVSTWNDEFSLIYMFRQYKKVFKCYTTYLWGRIGMRDSVKLVKSEDLGNFCPKRYEVSWEHQLFSDLDGYSALASWQYFVNGANTNRWKSPFHVWPWNCELQDLKISRYRDGLLFHVDYSQQEVRTMAALSGEDSLLQAYKEGKDVHRFVASRIYNKPEEDVSDHERRYAKMLTFSLLYGKTKEGIARDFFSGDLSRASDLIEGFFSGFPKIADFISLQHAKVDANVHYVSSILGEMIPLVGESGREGPSELKRYSVNYPIQSSASHITAVALSRICRQVYGRKYNIRVCGFTHDAGDFDVSLVHFFNFIDLLFYHMVYEIQSLFNIPVDIDIECGVTGNSMVELHIVERNDRRLVVDLCGRAQDVSDVLDRFSLCYPIYLEDHLGEKEVYMSRAELFAPKRAYSKALGSKVVKKTVRVSILC